MTFIPITLARRHVLGKHYNRCDRMTTDVSVYLNDKTGERLGFVDEGSNKYADAFTFHLPEDFCKKLADGHFIYTFEFRSSASLPASSSAKRRVKLTSIFLTMRPGRERPVELSTKLKANPS